MVKDLDFSGEQNEQVKINLVLKTIIPILLDHSLVIEEVFPALPQYNPSADSNHRRPNWLLEHEKNTTVSQEQLQNINSLNITQKDAFDRIIQVYKSKESGAFFIDGPGGAGNTSLYNFFLAKVRSDGNIALACASSGKFNSLLIRSV